MKHIKNDAFEQLNNKNKHLILSSFLKHPFIATVTHQRVLQQCITETDVDCLSMIAFLQLHFNTNLELVG